MGETNLILGLPGLPPESARNCHQELVPIANGEFRKSVNGNLLFLETVERKRYKSVVSCRDVNTPLVDELWIGSQITVGCIQNLWQAVNPGDLRVRLIRPAVAGSVSVVNNFGDAIKFKEIDNEVELYRPHEYKVFVCYRPWLVMIITDFSLETDEWGVNSGWKLSLEEV